MRFIVSSSQLNKGLQSIVGVVASSTTVPIIQNFLFSVSGNELVATATDLETTISATIPLSKLEGEGQVAIPHKQLIEILRNLPDVPVIFEVDEETWAVKLSAAEGEYSLVGFDANEFPKVPIIEGATTVNFKSEVLKKAITKTIFAVGNDEMRPAMSGVYIEFTDENITFVGTDAHKLMRFRRNDMTSETNASLIVPKKPLNIIKNNLADDDSEVAVSFNDTNVQFSTEGLNVIARLIDGRYPNYTAVIPNNNNNKLIVDRMALLMAIRRVAIFANASTMLIRLKIEAEQLQIFAEDHELSNYAHETMPCTYEGEPMEIGFSARYLLDMFSNADSAELRIEMSEPNRPGIIYPVEDANTDEDILMLVMPVMLKS